MSSFSLIVCLDISEHFEIFHLCTVSFTDVLHRYSEYYSEAFSSKVYSSMKIANGIDCLGEAW